MSKDREFRSCEHKHFDHLLCLVLYLLTVIYFNNSSKWVSKDREFRSCEHTHFDHLLCSATFHHFITMEYIISNKGGRKLAFKNNIYIKQKVLSTGAVCWESNQRRTSNTCKAKIHVLKYQVICRMNEHTHNGNSAPTYHRLYRP